jgi:two-component system, OmpR family, sensor histidine kinase QseC
MSRLHHMTSLNDGRRLSDVTAALRIVTDGAHEIRSQLAVILLDVGKINHSRARQIEVDVQTASETVNRVAIVFKLATAETLDCKTLHLSDILRGQVQRAANERPERVHQIELSDAAPSQLVEGNTAYLTEALRGLLDNAMRHTSVTSRIVVSRTAQGSVTIDDDGPGLPPSVASRFGEAFVHGRGPTAGVGLGLAFAHHVARLHGGRCYLAPSVLGGTCVALELSSPAASRTSRDDGHA